jgi:hypothetical protein
MVESLSKLDDYPWSGHSGIMGHRANDWHDRLFVLNGFGKQPRKARTAYRDFVEMGISLGRQPNLVGGGLVRSSGGWSEVKALRRIGEKEKGDERIFRLREFCITGFE